MILMILGKQGHPALTQAGCLLWAGLLAMPAVLLLVRADRGVAWLKSLCNALTWRRPDRRYEPAPPLEWSRWRDLDFGKRAVCLFSAAALPFAVLLVVAVLTSP